MKKARADARAFVFRERYLWAVVLGLAEAFAGAGFSAIAVSSMA
jgi:hypothetical protein